MRRMQWTCSVALTAALLAGGAEGCESLPETITSEEASAAAPAPEPVDPPVGPSARAPGATAGAASSALEVAVSDGTSTGKTPPRGWRRDGRPVWWLDEPQRDATRLALSAEALGADVLTARRNAVAAGRAALASRLGVAAVDAEILAAVVRPIGAAEASPSAAKYVGYVLAATAINDSKGDDGATP